METRQRKKAGTRVARANRHSAAVKSKNRTMQNTFFALILVVGLVFASSMVEDYLPWKVYSIGSRYVTKAGMALGVLEQVHGVMIDAGSTGSRVLAFGFHRSYDGSLKLDEELFVEVKPGLSSFADDPVAGAKTIEDLLTRAKGVIPQSAWTKTPLSLKATAGLRLLPAAKAEALLRAVRDVFKKSGFAVNDDAVTIMGGIEEGLFSWFTVNFLLDRLGGNSVAAFDLGGGSTQITFSPNRPETIKGAPAEFIQNVKGNKIYTNSYLGLGLMAARKEIFMQDGVKGTDLSSVCVSSASKSSWQYGGVSYTVTGKSKIPDYNKCSAVVEKVIGTKVHSPEELKSRDICAFSYYYDRAIDSGLIEPNSDKAVVTVQQFYNAAKKVCDNERSKPFLCLDLTFISTLLHKGFGLPLNNHVMLVKQIDGHEVSWALGAAYNILENGN